MDGVVSYCGHMETSIGGTMYHIMYCMYGFAKSCFKKKLASKHNVSTMFSQIQKHVSVKDTVIKLKHNEPSPKAWTCGKKLNLTL